MSIKKSIFKIFNGTSWDEYHHKTSADQVVYTKADGTASNVQKQLDEQNSTLKWSDWKLLGTNSIGIELRYRYNASEVELHYKGTLKELEIKSGTTGYKFPALPSGLNPLMNIEHQIYACAGENNGKLVLKCYPEDPTSNTFTITSHVTLTTKAEYICGVLRYTRG